MQHLDEVLALRTDPEAVPAVLMPLATMAPTDTLAARTLLQALLPGLLTLAATVSPGDAAAVEEMLSLAWERIRTYPSQRNGPVAGNVLLDVRKWYFEHRAIEAPPRPLWQLMETDEARVVPTPEDEVVGRMSFCDLMTAHRRAVGERCHRAIVRVDVEGFSLAEVAAEEGVDAHLVYQRRYDGRARIRRQPRSRTDAERKRVRTRDRFRLAHLAEGNAKQARKRVAANILLRDASGRVLLVNPNYKPYWDLPGGMAEAKLGRHQGTDARQLMSQNPRDCPTGCGSGRDLKVRGEPTTATQRLDIPPQRAILAVSASAARATLSNRQPTAAMTSWARRSWFRRLRAVPMRTWLAAGSDHRLRRR